MVLLPFPVSFPLVSVTLLASPVSPEPSLLTSSSALEQSPGEDAEPPLSTAPAASFSALAVLTAAILSSLSFCSLTCCSEAIFARSTPAPPAWVVFLGFFLPLVSRLLSAGSWQKTNRTWPKQNKTRKQTRIWNKHNIQVVLDKLL